MRADMIVYILTLVLVGVALYFAAKAKKKAELELDLERNRKKLDAMDSKLALSKIEYDKARELLVNTPIPDFMLEHVGKVVVVDVRNGRPFDTSTGTYLGGPGETGPTP